MRIEIVKKFEPADVADLISEFESKYGSLEHLYHRISVSQCNNPAEIDDYMVWHSLKEGSRKLKRLLILRSSELFLQLTPRRVELLDYLVRSDPKSIKEVAEELHRNYKNTYDDLLALKRWDLVDIKRHGKRSVPVSKVKSIRIYLGE